MTQDTAGVSLFQIVTLVHMGLMDLAMLALFLFRSGNTSGERRVDVTAQVAELKRRIDDAGHRMSKLATQIQSLPGVTSLMQRELEILQRDHEKTTEMTMLLRERLARFEYSHPNGDAR